MGADRLLQYKAVTAPPDQPAAAAEDVTLDKWYAAHPGPLRLRPRLLLAGATPPAIEPTPDAWALAPSVPTARTRPRQPDSGTLPAVEPNLPATVPDQWAAPLALPTRSRGRPPAESTCAPPPGALDTPAPALTPLRRYTLRAADRSVTTLTPTARRPVPDSLIADYAPPLRWPAGQVQTVRITPTLPTDRALGDWSTFTLTIREDPEYPRSGDAIADALTADPLAAEWESAAAASGTVSGSTISFAVTLPSEPGLRRYVIDVVAEGGTAGRVQLLPATWLTITPTLKAI